MSNPIFWQWDLIGHDGNIVETGVSRHCCGFIIAPEAQERARKAGIKEYTQRPYSEVNDTKVAQQEIELRSKESEIRSLSSLITLYRESLVDCEEGFDVCRPSACSKDQEGGHRDDDCDRCYFGSYLQAIQKILALSPEEALKIMTDRGKG